jgi:hypothetical protein
MLADMNTDMSSYWCSYKTDKSKTRTPEMAGNNGNIADRVDRINSCVETVRFNAQSKAFYTAVNR